MKHKIAVYPGSFDPLTFGHIDIIKRASQLFDHIHIVAAVSSKKKYLLEHRERTELLNACLAEIPNISVALWEGLSTKYLEQVGAGCILRGIRNTQDFLYEQDMASMNSSLLPGCESVLLFSNPKLATVSSSFIKEVASHGGNISEFVPPAVEAVLKKKFFSN